MKRNGECIHAFSGNRGITALTARDYRNLTAIALVLAAAGIGLVGFNGLGQSTPPPALTINPAGGLFTNDVNVSLSTTVNNAVIRYTLDNSDPTTNSTPYTGSFRFTTNTTVKAQAYVNGFPVSDLLAATYMITSVAAPLPPGAVSWWPGNGNSLDVIGGNDGILTNGATFGPGKVGQGFQLDGLKAIMVVPDAPSLNFSPGADLSVEAWIKVNPGVMKRNMTVVDKRIAPTFVNGVIFGGAVGYALYLLEGRLALELAQAPLRAFGQTEYTSAGPDLRDGVFHHVAATVDRSLPTGGKLYVDGQIVLTFSAAGEVGDLSNTEPLRIGFCATPGFDSYFSGLIDEVTLYNRALSATEIASIFSAGAAGKTLPANATEPGTSSVTVADWTFEEGVPGRRVTRVQDYSGRQHDGTIIFGSPTFVRSDPGSQGAMSIYLPPGDTFGSGFGLPDHPDFNLTNQFTLEAAIKPGPANNGSMRVIIQRPEGRTYTWSYSLAYRGDTRKIGFGMANLRGPDVGIETPFPADDRTHHVAAVYNNQFLYLYIDGVLGNSQRIDFVPDNRPKDGVFVGANHIGGYWFNGTMDRVRISNRALTPAEFFLVSSSTPPAISAYAKRQLPTGYTAGTPLTVSLQVTPPTNAIVYAVQDQPPAGWAVGAISASGSYDSINRLVKFGPFLDRQSRTLTYVVTPPAGSTAVGHFAGTVSVDGGQSVTGGDQDLSPANFHPADNNPADWRLTIGEMTAYSAAWKRGDSWPQPPNPIPITYVTRAAFLWKGGEVYRYDPSIATAPLYWVNSPRPAGLGAVRRPSHRALASTPGNRATATMSGSYQAGQPLIVSIEAKPGSGVAVYAVEDQPPAGWTAMPVSSDGVYDAATQKVKWGPFFDNTARTFSYQVKPPDGATGPMAFSGLASFDGANVNIAGVRQADWGGSALPRLSVARDSAGTEIVFTGNPGQMYRLEYSPDLLNWQRLDPIIGTNGPSAYLDASFSVRPAAFYRLVSW